MNKELREKVIAVLEDYGKGQITLLIAAEQISLIPGIVKDASSGVSPDNSKNDGTGCTLVFA